MSDRDRYIPGVPCWVDTSQPDPEAAAEFYGGLFGWELEDTMPADAPGSYFVARLGGRDVAAVSSPMGEAPPQATWNTYVWVESADETAAKVRDAGGTVLAEPFDVMEAGRMAVCADREGAAFCLWQAKEHRGAQVVNEPGALNFNTLGSGDIAGAKEFYGAVFGWETLTMNGGFEMWTLPGYGEFLDEINPGTLERMAEVGAPQGFADVVASLLPLAAAAARHAAELGRHLRRRGRRRDRRQGNRARRQGPPRPRRRPLGPHHRDRRPPRRRLHRQQIRPREQRPRRPTRRSKQRLIGPAVFPSPFPVLRASMARTQGAKCCCT